MYQPLQGVKVIDFTLAGSGPSCTKLLAEYGADVIWVEPLSGTSTRDVHKFDFYTTNKRNITLNLKTEKGKEAVYRMLKTADVFVSNYRPKAVKKLGLDYETISALNPQIIYATLTGFGEEGEEANNPGYDPVAFWAKGGLLRDIAERGSLVVPPIAVGDITAGMCLAGGITTALYGREKTGKGCKVSTSLLAQAAYLNHDALIETQYGEDYPKTRLKPRRSLLNTYQCSDGEWITMTVVRDFDKFWNPLLKVLGLKHLVGDSRWQKVEDTMYDGAAEVVRILDEAFSKMTQDEAIAALKSIDVPVDRVQSTRQFMKDPQVLANKMVYRLEATTPPDDADREILVPANPLKLGDVDSGVIGNKRGPRLGEHSAILLKEYGFSEEEIERMIEEGVTSVSDHK